MKRNMTTLLVALFAAGAWAETETINYIDAEGNEVSHEVTILTGSTASTSLDAGWYAVKGDAVSYNGQLQFSAGDVCLILCDEARLTINSGSTHALLVEGNLTIYGQAAGNGTLEASATYSSSGIRANGSGDIVFNGGIVTAKSSNGAAVSTNGNIVVNGGSVKAISTGSHGLRATHINLGWRTASDRILAKAYELENGGTLSVAIGKALTDGEGVIYTGALLASDLANKTLMGTNVLYDHGTEAADNASHIASLADEDRPANVTLSGRTLYTDGTWNTLCLPFDVSIGVGVLEGATVKRLSTATSNLTGTMLTLDFEDERTALTAGTPYLVRWENAEGTIENPTFANVAVTTATHHADFSGGSFKGTYSSTTYEAANPNILFMGESNILYYPLQGATIGAFHAYFDLGSNDVKGFVLNFGEGRPTFVSLPAWREAAGAVYTLDGRKIVNGQIPKGIYVRDGRKIVNP